MNKQGIIRSFENKELAIDMGFDTILSNEEAKTLTPLPVAERHAALKRMREAETRHQAANTANRRNKSRAARKARRIQRDK
jgi:hypothetical protein